MCVSECDEHETFSHNEGCEYSCSHLKGRPLHPRDCKPVPPGCQCKPGFYRDSGKCVKEKDCECIVSSTGEKKKVMDKIQTFTLT